MYNIDIIILSIIILIITLLIFDIYLKNTTITNKFFNFFESFNNYDVDRLGPIKFVNDASDIIGYYPNGTGDNGQLSQQQLNTISDENLTFTTIRIPTGGTGEKGKTGDTGEKGVNGPQGNPGLLFMGEPGNDGPPATPCKNGNDAPPCTPCTPGKNGKDAENCSPGPTGPPGINAPPCTPCTPGKNGKDAENCENGTPGDDGHNAEDCTCVCDDCNPVQCTGDVNLTTINGNSLTITAETSFSQDIKITQTNKICIGDSCIDKNILDKINKLL